MALPAAPAGQPPRIEGYDRFSPLGSGGTATVWSARQIALGREVAIKALDPALVCGDAEIDRFQSEARTAARLSHPGIVRVFDAFYRDGEFCIVMEKLAGETLAARIARSGPLPESEAVAVARSVADALRHAWARERLVHRDLKPENVMICRDGRVKVMDFGLASSASCLQARRSASAAGGTPEWVWGTPAYMSPEQAVGRAAPAPQSDMYSLGATLFHAVTGRALFAGAGDENAVMAAQVSAVDASPRELVPALSLPFCDVLERLLAKRPADRFPGWEAAVEALDALARPGGADLRRPPLPAARRTGAGAPFSSVRHAPGGDAPPDAPPQDAAAPDAPARAPRRRTDGFSPVPPPLPAALLFAAFCLFAASEFFAASRVARAGRRLEAAREILDAMPDPVPACAPAFAPALAWCDEALAAPGAGKDRALFALVSGRREAMLEALREAERAETASLSASWRAVVARGGAAAAASGLLAYAGPLAGETAAGRRRVASGFAGASPRGGETGGEVPR